VFGCLISDCSGNPWEWFESELEVEITKERSVGGGRGTKEQCSEVRAWKGGRCGFRFRSGWWFTLRKVQKQKQKLLNPEPLHNSREFWEDKSAVDMRLNSSKSRDPKQGSWRYPECRIDFTARRISGQQLTIEECNPKLLCPPFSLMVLQHNDAQLSSSVMTQEWDFPICGAALHRSVYWFTNMLKLSHWMTGLTRCSSKQLMHACVWSEGIVVVSMGVLRM